MESPQSQPTTIRGVASAYCDLFQQRRRVRPISPTFERNQPRNVLFSPECFCKLVSDDPVCGHDHLGRLTGDTERGKGHLPGDRGSWRLPEPKTTLASRFQAAVFADNGSSGGKSRLGFDFDCLQKSCQFAGRPNDRIDIKDVPGTGGVSPNWTPIQPAS